MARGQPKTTNPQALLGYEGQLGAVADWDSTASIVLRPKPSLPRELAYRLGRSHESREFAIPSMTGASRRPRVPAESPSLYLLAVSLGNVATQFGAAIKPQFARASVAGHESRTFTALRDTLLPNLISSQGRGTNEAHISMETPA